MLLKKNLTRTLFKLTLPLVVLGLSACAQPPTRDTPNGFTLMHSGWIEKSNVPSFLECVTDAFKAVPQNGLLDHSTHQERRKAGYRIEIRASGVVIIVSADVSDDGFTELFESNFVNSSIKGKGVAAFNVCLMKYQTTAPKT